MKIAIFDRLRQAFEGHLPAGIETAWYTTPADVTEAGRGADVLVMGFIERDEIRTAVENAPSIRWLSSHAAGVDQYPFELLRERGVTLTNGSGLGAAPIAEFIVLCILSAAKTLPFFLASSARHEWPRNRPPAMELEGTRALVVGYGAIGEAVGERLRKLDVQVTGVRRRVTGEPNMLSSSSDWQARLGEFDWVILTTALTAETHHLIGRDELARMKPTSWLVNIARGSLIDQPALTEALHAGRPRGAYLDVTEPEPLPSDDPLWSAPNIFITGHSSGRGERSMQRYAALFADNLARFQAGQPLLNLVDLTAGY